MGAIIIRQERVAGVTERVGIGSIAHEKELLRFVLEGRLELSRQGIDINSSPTKDVYHRQPSDSSISDHTYTHTQGPYGERQARP